MRKYTLNRSPIHSAALAVAFVLAFGVAVQAAPANRIKLATLAPTGSSYHKSLLAMKDAWRKSSGGTVDLIIYADGKLGGEADTVNLMNIKSIQASMVTTVGLSEIEPAVTGLQNIPMGFRNFEEVDYVGSTLQPMLEERLLKKGYIVLFWSDAGWVRFFSKRPVQRPDDLRKLKLSSWAGFPEQVEIYKSSGFNAVPLETADILPSLQTGLIEAVPCPPVFALAGQIDGRAPYMLELNWAPLIGACVVRADAWEKIPQAIRDELRKTSKAAGDEIRKNGRKESEESVKAMVKRGLKVTPVTPEVEAEWRVAAEAAYPRIRGKLVPAEVFDTTLSIIKEYRARKAQ